MQQAKASNGSRAETLAIHRQAVERVIAAMHERLGDELSLQELADVAIMSPFHFNRVFNRVTGLPPGRFLSALRIEAAKRRLLTTSENITDTCFAVGYNSLGTFTRRYTELVGVSPRRFRALAHPGIRAALASLRRRSVRSHFIPSRSGIVGSVRTPDGFQGSVFVGLFPTAIPQSRPLACSVAGGDGSFRLPPMPDGKYFLFAAGVRWSLDPKDYLLYERALRGGPEDRSLRVRDRRVVGSTEIYLRAPEVVDPPILMTFPLLIAERLARSSRQRRPAAVAWGELAPA